MELTLKRRKYAASYTSGVLLCKKRRVCFTIERPWNKNTTGSCIPEGRYRLRRRYTSLRNWSLHVENVRLRNWTMIQALQFDPLPDDGNIAMVSQLLGRGRGIRSGAALRRLLAFVQCTLDKDEPLFLTIKSI